MANNPPGDDMTDKHELIALAERVEALTKPCQETDAHIRKAVYCPQGFVELSPFNGRWCVFDGTYDRSGRPRGFEGPGKMMAFTASLDASMTLVPEGVYFAVRNLPPEPAWAYCGDRETPSTGIAATPALALTAAALRSLAERERQQ